MEYRTVNITKQDLIDAGVTEVTRTSRGNVAVFKGDRRLKSTGLWISVWSYKEKLNLLLFLDQIYELWNNS